MVTKFPLHVLITTHLWFSLRRYVIDMLGCTRAELVGSRSRPLNFFDLVHADDRQLCSLKRLLDERHFHADVRMMRADTSLPPVWVNVNVVAASTHPLVIVVVNVCVRERS